jgi:hypothetical protein
MAGHPLYDYAIGLGIDQRQMARAIEKNSAILRKTYGEAMSHAAKGAFAKHNLKGLEKAARSAGEEMARTQIKIMMKGEEMRRKGISEEAKARLKSEMDVLKARRNALKEESKKRVEAAKTAAKEWTKETERLQKAAGRRKAFTDEWTKGAGSRGREGMSKFLEGIFSGDVKGLMSSGKMGAKVLGKGATKFAGSDLGRKMGGGKALEALGSLGGTLAKLTTVMMAVGAVAGALAVLVKVFLEADKLVKEMNASLLKSNVAAADLGGNWLNLEDRLEEVRDSFNKFSFMSAWKVLPKESLKIVDAFGAAGLKVSQFTAGLEEAADRQQKLRDVTETALVYANLTGMTGTEVATKMGEYMDNLAMSLESVREGFSSVYRVANESGYSTKKFFGMVLQATSGLTMYNVRLEQTAGLLKELTSALGLKDGFELLQKILGQMKGKSVEQGARDIIASKGGEAATRRRLQREAEHQASVFLEAIKKGGFGSIFSGAAEEVGVKLDLSSQKGLVDSLKAMSNDQFTKFYASLIGRATSKEEKDQVRALREMRKHLIPGLSGDAVNMSGAMGRGGPVFQLLQMMAQLSGAAGLAGQSGKDISGYGLLAAEKLGIDKDTAQKLASTMEDMTARLYGLQAQAAKIKSKGEIGDQAENVRLYGGGIRWNEKTGQAEVVKGVVDAFGQAFLEGPAIKNIEDWLYANEAVLRKIAEGGDSQEVLLAKSIAENTNETTKILGAMKDGVLMDIFKGVNAIISFFIKDDLKRGTKVIRNEIMSEMDKWQGRAKELGEAKRNIASILPNVRDPEQRRKLQAQLATVTADEKVAQDNLTKLRDAMTKLNETLATNPEKISGAISWTDMGEVNEDTQRKLKSMFDLDKLELIPVEFKKNGVFWKSNAKSAKDTAEMLKQMREEALSKVPKKTGDEVAGAMLTAQAMMAGLQGINPKGRVLSESGRRTLAKHLATGNFSPEDLEEFRRDPDYARRVMGIEGLPPESKAAIEEALRGPKADDLGMIVGDGRVKMAQRIDRRDQVLAFAREGGALSKGGGGVTNVQNNFWEGKGAFNSMRQLEKAKGRFA